MDELGEEVLWRSVGILNASKGLMLVQKESSPILEPGANFNWGGEMPLLSKNLATFKQIQETNRGVIFSSDTQSTIQKKLKSKTLFLHRLRQKKKRKDDDSSDESIDSEEIWETVSDSSDSEYIPIARKKKSAKVIEESEEDSDYDESYEE